MSAEALDTKALGPKAPVVAAQVAAK